jgi:hypothetical protein
MNTFSKKDNELAIVHTSNKIMLDDLKKEVINTKRDMKLLLSEIDDLPVKNISTQELGNIIDEFDKRSITSASANIIANYASDWESTLLASQKEIISHGIDPDEIYIDDLLSPEENYAIQQKLNRPLYDRIPWDKWDYIFSFGAGLIGGGLDIFLGTPGSGLQAQMADKNSWIGSQMEKIHHLHPVDAPIDYQGKHFGGGYHRGLTKAHDLFRPLEGIRQFMDGEFRGFYWVDGKKYFIESSVNQFGKSYQTMDFGDAVLAWMIHMFCDFFSSTSLPIPGTSYIYGMDNRDLRVLVEKDIYQSGINLRHLVLQTIPTISIELILRSYVLFRYHNKIVNSDALTQKKTELLAVGHSVCAGFNIGKVIVLSDPLLINLPQLFALSKTLIRLALQESKRNSFYNKTLRNLKELHQTQKKFENLIEKELPEPIILQGNN